MEAAAAGALGFLSPGFKFNPADEDLVDYFLVARLLQQAVPLKGIIIDDDPRSAPPWELLRKHGRREDDEAFFFAESTTVNGKPSRHRQRTCASGGKWQGQGQKSHGKVLVGGVEVVWKKYLLSFVDPGETKTSGWVMYEYAASTRLYRIHRTIHGSKSRKRKCGESDSSELGDGAAAAEH